MYYLLFHFILYIMHCSFLYYIFCIVPFYIIHSILLPLMSRSLYCSLLYYNKLCKYFIGKLVDEKADADDLIYQCLFTRLYLFWDSWKVIVPSSTSRVDKIRFLSQYVEMVDPNTFIYLLLPGSIKISVVAGVNKYSGM